MTIMGVVLGQLLGGVLVSLYPFLLDWSPLQTENWFNSTGGQFVFVLLSEAFTVLVLWLFLRRRRTKLSSLGFTRRPRWQDIGYVLAGTVTYIAMLILTTALIGTLFQINVDQKQEIGFEQVAGLSALLMAFISLVILPPLVEETLFRGFLYGGLRTKLNMWGATIITSLLFAAPHLLASSEGLLWIAGVDTFVLSIVLCYVRETTGSLWASIGVHALKNGIAFIYLFVRVQ